MNGPEHYQEAEQLLSKAASAAIADFRTWLLAGAQVHATLALTAANVALCPEEEWEAWSDAMASGTNGEKDTP